MNPTEMIQRIAATPLARPETAHWIQAPFTGTAVYLNTLQLDRELHCTLSLSAGSGFRLYLNGAFIDKSSMQHTPEQCFYESFTLHLPPGPHELAVMVWDFQNCAALSRVQLSQGMICICPEEPDLLQTGQAPWRSQCDSRFSFARQDIGIFQCVTGSLQADYTQKATGESEAPRVMEVGKDAWLFRQCAPDDRRLSPMPLPAFNRSQVTTYHLQHVDSLPGEPYCEANNQLSSLKEPFRIPPNSVRRLLVVFDDYVCADYSFTIDGGLGGQIQVAWAEALFTDAEQWLKTNRSQVEGLSFKGLADCYTPSGGGDDFFNVDYRTGRYVEVLIETGAEALCLHHLCFTENRFPLEWAGNFSCSNPRLERMADLAFRTLQMCAHDTFMDCPYFEQLNYIGDGRLQLLSYYVTAEDLSLADHVLQIWSEGVRNEGVPVSIYPARTVQVIPGFALFWVSAVSDYIRWRNEPKVTARIFPIAVRSLMAWEDMLNADGVLVMNRGWLFVDWCDGWEGGCPPTDNGLSCIFNAMYLYVLHEFATTCRMMGETELSERFSRKADELYVNIRRVFYDDEHGLFCDLPNQAVFSEHANALMLLSGRLPEKEHTRVADGLFTPQVPLVQATLYFSFYYMEAAFAARRPEAALKRMEWWTAMDDQGVKTLLEKPDPSRSDCHAWSSHVLYHLIASVAGYRPAEPGARSFTHDPQLGCLEQVTVELPPAMAQALKQS